jgi:hypothetical protein
MTSPFRSPIRSFAAVELAAELRRALDGLCPLGVPKVRENEEWLAGVDRVQCEGSAQGEAALLHLGSAEQSLVCRVLHVPEESGDRVELEVSRFGYSSRAQLEFIPGGAPRETRRHLLALDTKQRLYRAQPERWLLEPMVAGGRARIDARLDPRHICAPVPAFSSGSRRIIDLLGVTRDGRLSVLEQRASEGIHRVRQAVDDWLRVRFLHEQDDLSGYGYSPEVRPNTNLLSCSSWLPDSGSIPP